MSMKALTGYCPMGCGQTLALLTWLPKTATIVCSNSECPEPKAVMLLLASPETEHIVEIEHDTFAIKHPLRERIADELFTCHVHEDLAAMAGRPVAPGRYRVVWNGDPDYGFEPVP